MGHNSQYSFGSQYIITDVTSPVWGFVISQSGFFCWLAVRPRDFVWPGLKVTETESEAVVAGSVEPYFWVI